MIDRLSKLFQRSAATKPSTAVAPPTFPAHALPTAPVTAPPPVQIAVPPPTAPVVPKVVSIAREWPRRAPEAFDPQVAQQIQRREEVLSQSIYFKHWQAIKAEGITASQFMEFLQPFADLDGISVSYIYSDPEGNERIYNHRKEDSFENPLSVAIKEKKISKDQALNLALNEEGRVWIESNFTDLS